MLKILNYAPACLNKKVYSGVVKKHDYHYENNPYKVSFTEYFNRDRKMFPASCTLDLVLIIKHKKPAHIRKKLKFREVLRAIVFKRVVSMNDCPLLFVIHNENPPSSIKIVSFVQAMIFRQKFIFFV